MPEIIFAKPVHHYDSYTDFWQLVELSGFPIISVDEIDLNQRAVFITAPFNGDWEEYISGQIELLKKLDLQRLAHLIVWNLERPSGSSGSVSTYAVNCYDWMYKRLADEVWVSDPALADETQLRYVVLGSDYGLGEPGENKKYDFAHMSVVIPRRSTIYSMFGEHQIGQNAWGAKRHNILQASRFAVNVHQDNFPYCEPLRIALFAAYGLPIISETLRDSFPYAGDIVTHNYHGLVAAIKTAINEDYRRWKNMGMRLRKLLCDDLQFGKMVRRAVNETAGKGWR